MKHLYLDCFAGVSGDMFVGALIDLGVDLKYLKNELKKLPITGYEVAASQVRKNGIPATFFQVFVQDPAGLVLADNEIEEMTIIGIGQPGAPNQRSSSEPHHPAEEQHAHSHPGFDHHSLHDILDLLDRSSLSDKVRQTAKRIYQTLGEAEAVIHGMSVETVSFHEVGSLDAIIDITSAAIGLDYLEIDRIECSALHLGSGFVKSSHGILPVPAPATAILLKGVPVYQTEAKGELVTPTGAAILVSVVDAFGPMPAMVVERTGYGAGRRDREFPNTLRAFLGESGGFPSKALPASTNRNPSPEQHLSKITEYGYHENQAVVLEANIDNMNPELSGNLMDCLLMAGAMDVLFLPAQLKKNRPGFLLQVLTSPEILPELVKLIFLESTTLGVRSYPVTKHMLQREITQISTRYGPIRIKIGRLGDQTVNLAPEYEDCLLAAQRHQQPLKLIYAQAMADALLLYPLVGK